MILDTQTAPANCCYRPERDHANDRFLDIWARRTMIRLLRNSVIMWGARRLFLRRVERHSARCARQETAELVARARELGSRIRVQGYRERHVAELFAIVREAAGRTLGKRHFPTQVQGGWLLLHGCVAEMQTGEGKTMTAVLPVITAAVSGIPVHVITVNDYLTERDAQEMQPLYSLFGLSVGVVVHSAQPAQRRAAYDSDITYVTGKELVFDYLRDRMRLQSVGRSNVHLSVLKDPDAERRLLLRGLHFALVDEADSVLIDESRTPLIISGVGGGEDEQRFICEAYDLSLQLQEGVDFVVESERRKIDLTESGRNHLERLVAEMGPIWRGAIRREEIVHKALLARYLYQKDKDYLLREGKIELVDQLTGRVMEGRSWEKGLHQLVELKEGCELTQQRQTLARISYQNFFRRYLYLCGMTGTARQLRSELWRTYGLLVRSVPTYRPSRRVVEAWSVFDTDQACWQAVQRRCLECIERGQAVLIGTASVRQSEEISRVLRQANIRHQVLSAKQDRDEAQVISRAGEPCQVTVATSMAGRGTDIQLAPSVAEAGGLYVIQTDLYESSRVDRQLAGRCARQGDPGVYAVMLSLESRVYATRTARLASWLSRYCGGTSFLGRHLAIQAILAEQRYIERCNYHAREATLEYDRQQRDLMAFSGLGE